MTHTVREKRKLLARVRRIKGQVEGIERALETEAGCDQVMHLIAGCRGAIAGLMAGALVFALSFYVISIACDYRYLDFLDMAAITGALKLASGSEKNSSPTEPF